MIDKKKLEEFLHGQSVYNQIEVLKKGAFGRTGQELAGIEFEELFKLAVDLVTCDADEWEEKIGELESYLR